MSQDALDLLLSGVKDQGQRKQITSAYYSFASGDPETFAVQFAILLRAHALSLRGLPNRFEKAFAAQSLKLTDAVVAHQNSVERMLSMLDEKVGNAGVGEGRLDALSEVQNQIQEQLIAHAEILRAERERIASAVATNGRLFQKLAAQRILLGLILSFVAGVLSVLVFQHVLPLLLRSLV
jgi:glutamate mutase epsilon subunit